jgi:hypothetical protein
MYIFKIPFNIIAQVTHDFQCYLRLAVYRQSVRLGAKPLEAHEQSFYILYFLGN